MRPTPLSRRCSVALVEEGSNTEATNSQIPRVVVEYCPGCRWMLRSAWLAQELLSTFETELFEVALRPSRVAGTFEVRVDGKSVWERRRDGGFPEAKVLKQRVRDVVRPGMDLGHSEAAKR
ncbi:unnamed protein product [Phaeothamnion confervicola]